MPDKAKGQSYYTVLTGFGFKPVQGEWKRFSKKFKAIKNDNFYLVYIAASAGLNNNTQNSLYLDNFKIEVLGKTKKNAAEIAIIPSQLEAVYNKDEEISFNLRALLDSSGDTETVILDIQRDYDDKIVKKLNVKLKKNDFVKGLYTGTVNFKADLFGAFHCSVSNSDNILSVAGGDFSVIHPLVKHKYLSPGWSIGFNKDSSCPSGRNPKEIDFTSYYWLFFGSFEREFRIARMSGMNLSRFWGHWRYIEPEENQFRLDVVQPSMDMYKKYDIDVMFVLGADMMPYSSKEDADKTFASNKNNIPAYMQKYYKMASEKRGSIQPPMDVYKRYLDYVLATWGKDVKVWELFNEPGLGGTPAKVYIDYLKETYKTVKAFDKNAPLLANGVTGDFGMNVIKWCESLNEADPDYENYLDGIAFHPYGGCLDYQKGNYFLYTKVISDIRSKLKYKKPLWNTECFYITNSRKPQREWYINLSEVGAGEHQRHLLESMMNGVKGITALAETSMYKRSAPVTIAPASEIVPATNALSFMLKDMEKLEVLSLNKFIKSGVFSSQDGSKALGFVYDLRPSGSRWELAASPCKIYDLFGNPVTEKSIALTYEPYYIFGPPAEVKACLEKSKFIPSNPLGLKGRFFKDTLYIEGKNNSGAPCGIEVSFKGGDAVPAKVEFVFGNELLYNTLAFKGASIKKSLDWEASVGGEKSGKGTLEILPSTGDYELAGEPVKFTLSKGSLLELSSDAECLKIKAFVKESSIDAAKNSNLWEGDAVEIFIDPQPFSMMDQPYSMMAGGASMNVYQYVFAAAPSENGMSIRAMNKLRGDFKSKASSTTEKTDGGYVLSISIPFNELEGLGKDCIIGMDLEIDHQNAGKTEKESLGSMPGRSYIERLHYPLFKINGALKKKLNLELQNKDFTLGTYGDPEGWCYKIFAGTAVKTVDGIGFGGKRGLLLSFPEGSGDGKSPLAVIQRIKVEPALHGLVVFSGLLRTEGLKQRKLAHISGKETAGLLFLIDFYDVKGKHLGSAFWKDQQDGDFPAKTDWKIYQFFSAIPSGTAELTLQCGIKANACGIVYVDNVDLSFL